jgi:hypothetical protein
MSLPEGFRSTFAPDEPEAVPLELLGGLLDNVGAFVRRFVVMSDVQADAVTLWIAHTHAVGAGETTPYLAVTSAEKRSGKTRLREVLELLVSSALSASNISDAALFRAVEKLTPTLLLDEADAVFKAREREDLRGMLNAGYRRGAVAYRMGGANKTTLEAFPVFCAKAFFGIGDFLPDTLADRAIPIRLQRRTSDEPVERFRRREVEPEGHAPAIVSRPRSSRGSRSSSEHGRICRTSSTTARRTPGSRCSRSPTLPTGTGPRAHGAPR